MAKRDTYPGFMRTTGRRSTVGAIADSVLLILTIVFAILLSCAYLARYITPEKTWILAFIGLVTPALYILNIATLLYWAMRWRRFAFISLVILLFGISNITLFFRPSVSKNYQSDNPNAAYVMSYNIMGFMFPDNTGKMHSSIDSLTAFIRSHEPSILCLQEFQSRSTEQKEMIDSLLGMRYSAVNYVRTNSSGGGWGTAIYSNFPIVNSGNISFPDSNNSSIWADVVVASGDTIRIYSNHLQTTSVNESDRRYISNTEFMANTPDREERVRGILSKLKRNYLIRASQADTLAPIIHSSPYPLIVCGDFNDTPMSYVYSKVKGNLSDTFAEKGQGFNTNTFKGLFNIFRIDYILHSRSIKAVYYSTPQSIYSDHKAVLAGFEL